MVCNVVGVLMCNDGGIVIGSDDEALGIDEHVVGAWGMMGSVSLVRGSGVVVGDADGVMDGE